jgi:hypothetical protein
MYTLFFNFFDFKQSGRQVPVGGMHGQNYLGFCDIMNQKQNKQTDKTRNVVQVLN